MSMTVGRAVCVALVAVLAVAGVAGTDDPDDSRAGKALFDKKCAMCHGKDGVAKPMAKGSADFNDPEWQSSVTVEAIVAITAAGKGKMPGYRNKLSPDEIRSIATWVKRLK